MQGLQSAVTAVWEPRCFPQGRLGSAGLSRGFAPAGPPRSCPLLGDLARLAARPESRQRHLPGPPARARPSSSDSRAASRAHAPVRAAGPAGEGYGGARGGAWAGPGCCAPRQAPCRRRLRARSPRRSVSAVAAAVIVAWRCGGSLGCEKAAAARRRWPLEPAGLQGDKGRQDGGCCWTAPSRLQSLPSCRVRAAPGRRPTGMAR